MYACTLNLGYEQKLESGVNKKGYIFHVSSELFR